MPQPLEVEKLIANNPSVDRKQMDEARLAIKQLRSEGVKRAEYDLEVPFSRQPARTPDAAQRQDPRGGLRPA
jgi:hypothetical protein